MNERDALLAVYASARGGVPAGTPLAVFRLGDQAASVAAGQSGPVPGFILDLELGAAVLASRLFSRDPPSPRELEDAIAVVEDELTRALPAAAPGALLFVEGAAAAQVAAAALGAPLADSGAWTEVSRDAVERLFSRATSLSFGRSAAGAQLPTEPGFLAAALVLRELLHHLDFSGLRCRA